MVDSPRSLEGSWTTVGPIVPKRVENEPPPTGLSTQTFTVQRQFECTSAGDGRVDYIGRIRFQAKYSTLPTQEYGSFPWAWIFVECIPKLDTTEPKPTTDELTNTALGFSQDSLNWVTFEQNGIVLRINQIEPVKLNVGDSVEIYSDFDAKPTLDDRDRELRDAKLEFTIGGPIRIDSPPARQSDLYAEDSKQFPGNKAVLWGFRSGTLTCLSEGEGVYSSVLTGFLGNGGTITQTVSGLVDCVEPPATAAPDAVPQLAVVYTIDGRPYDRVQFQLHDGHDGCTLTHVHSNVTVYPFQEWNMRGFPDAPLRRLETPP